jgi:hypothetical protein
VQASLADLFPYSSYAVLILPKLIWYSYHDMQDIMGCPTYSKLPAQKMAMKGAAKIVILVTMQLVMPYSLIHTTVHNEIKTSRACHLNS